jgi:hypothetical protein
MSKSINLISLFLIFIVAGCVPASKLEGIDERLTQLESQNFIAYQQLIEQYQQLLEKSQILVARNQELSSTNKELARQIEAFPSSDTSRLPSQILPSPSSWPFVTIAVDDNLRISRTLGPEGLSSISWVILFNGQEVLQKNTLNETQYTYYRQDPGIYTIYVTAFIDNAYRVISNVISYTIE